MKTFMSFSLLPEIPMLRDFRNFLKQIHFGDPNREACYSPHNWKVTYKLRVLISPAMSMAKIFDPR